MNVVSPLFLPFPPYAAANTFTVALSLTKQLRAGFPCMLTAFIVSSVALGQSYTITSFAGTGRQGGGGDNGPATSASFDLPDSVTVDSAGNVYVADVGSNSVRKITNGTITTVASVPGISPTGLTGPDGIAVDPAGNLYIADTVHNQVLKVANGITTTIAGNGAAGFRGDGGPAIAAQLNTPTSVALDAAGNLYIADNGNRRIRMVSGGIITTIAGNGGTGYGGDGGPAINAPLFGPAGLIADNAGNLYFVDSARIREVSNGVITTVAGGATAGFSGDNGPATAATLTPQAVAVDSVGNLYVAEASNNRVRKISHGIITTIAGSGPTGYPGAITFSGDGGPATNARLLFVTGIAVDSLGNVYVADDGNHRIRLLTPGNALPDLVSGDVWTTGILAINTSPQSANFSVSFLGDGGSALNLPFSAAGSGSINGTLPGLGSLYAEASAPLSTLVQGWGQVAAGPGVATQALFRDHQPNGNYYEAAVPSNGGATEFLAPFDFTLSSDQQQLSTGFAISNLEQSPATLTCMARNSAGVPIPNGVQISAIPGLGHWSGFNFPALAGQRGTVDCISNTNVAALAVRYYGATAFSSLPVINNPSTVNSTATLALPDVVSGANWTTGFFVINTGAQPAPYTISFYSDAGNPMSLNFSTGAANTVSGMLAPNGSIYFEASNPEGALQQGWAQVTAGPSVVAQALFRDAPTSGNYFEAAVPASPIGSKEFIAPFDYTTSASAQLPIAAGFAIANLDSQAAAINCTARNSAGVLIPNAVQIPSLSARGHWTGFNFPLLNGLQGTVDCVSNTNITALAVRYFGGETFSSLPVISK